MRDYRKLDVYHSLDQLALEVFAAARSLAPEDRPVIGDQMQKAVSNALSAVVRGCSTRNYTSFIPYLEEAHGATEELGQWLRVAQRMKMLDLPESDFLLQRQRGCSQEVLRLLKRMLFRAEEAGELSPDIDADAWGQETAVGGIATLPAPARKVSRPRVPGSK